MTVHFRGRCIPVQNIVCYCTTETKWKKKQPRLVMQGYAQEVKIVKDTAYIT